MNEEISIPAGPAERTDQRSFSESEMLFPLRPKLTIREREIAISAISALASGPPAEAAIQLLAGIAVLDGEHSPILIWPADMTREEKAAWHCGEAAYWENSRQRFDGFMASAPQSAVRTQPLDVQSIGEPDRPLPLSASAPVVPHAVEKQTPLHSESGVHPRVSSDAC